MHIVHTFYIYNIKHTIKLSMKTSYTVNWCYLHWDLYNFKNLVWNISEKFEFWYLYQTGIHQCDIFRKFVSYDESFFSRLRHRSNIAKPIYHQPRAKPVDKYKLETNSNSKDRNIVTSKIRLIYIFFSYFLTVDI